MSRRISRKKRWFPKGVLFGCELDADGKLHQAGPGQYYVTQKHWVADIDDEEIQLALVFNIINMEEATGEEFGNYPYNMEAEIMVACPGPDAIAKCQTEEDPAENPEGVLFDVYQYFGGVPVTHILLTEIEGGGANFEKFPARQVTWQRTAAHHGTFAAQHRPGAVFEYPMFADEETAVKFAKEMLKLAPALFGMIGFILDRPINLIGDTGWKTIGAQAK